MILDVFCGNQAAKIFGFFGEERCLFNVNLEQIRAIQSLCGYFMVCSVN